MKLRICITGGIACGKSLVGGVLYGMGVPVRDADDVCHELMRSGTGLYERIVAAFGMEIVRADGELDRRALSAIVCADSVKREVLNGLVHPKARAEMEDWTLRTSGQQPASGQEGKGSCCIAAIIPLVFEAGWGGDWDKIVCVAAPATQQIERLKQRGLPESEAAAWIKAQLPVEEKMKRSDYVIFNAGSLECAEMQVREMLRDICSYTEK